MTWNNKGDFIEVKCFVICTALLLPLKVNFYYFNIQIFMLLKLESESGIRNPESGIRNPNPNCKKFALESGIRIRQFFAWIAIPDKYNIIFRKIRQVLILFYQDFKKLHQIAIQQEHCSSLLFNAVISKDT